MNNNYIFITGPGRCGTNLLLSLLDGNKNLNVFPGEPTSFFKNVILKNSLTKQVYSFNFEYFLNIFLNEIKNTKIKFNKKKFKSEINKKIKNNKKIDIQTFLDKIMSQIFNNKKPIVINIQDEDIVELLNHFPNSKVIHMIRNPLYQINSRYNFRYKKPNNYDGFEFGNSFYRNYNSFKNAYICLENKRVKIIKLENIITKPEKEIKKLFKFLKFKSEPINYYSSVYKKRVGVNELYNGTYTNNNFSKRIIDKDISSLTPNDLYVISKLEFVKHFYKIKKFKYKKNNYFLFFLRHLGFIGRKRILVFNPFKIIKLSIYSIYLYFLDCYFKKKLIFQNK